MRTPVSLTLAAAATAALLAVPHADASQRAAVAPPHDFSRFAPSIHRQLAGHVEGGYALAVMHGGAIVAADTFGWARTPWERDRPGLKWTLDTSMALASVSKTITAVALLHLWDERKQSFSLDDPFWPHVERLFPDARPEVRRITIRHCGPARQLRRAGEPGPGARRGLEREPPLIRPDGLDGEPAF